MCLTQLQTSFHNIYGWSSCNNFFPLDIHKMTSIYKYGYLVCNNSFSTAHSQNYQHLQIWVLNIFRMTFTNRMTRIHIKDTHKMTSIHIKDTYRITSIHIKDTVILNDYHSHNVKTHTERLAKDKSEFQISPSK